MRKVLLPPSEGAGIDSRPIVNLSLALNYAVSGLNPRGFRLTNVAGHLLAALALFGLVRRTLLLPSLVNRWGTAALPVALGTALLWTVHPLQTETVICVIQRTEGLASLCFVTMLYSFVRGCPSASHRGWLIIAWLACLLGMATKEIMVGAPLLAFLFDRTFVAGTFRESWRQRGGWHAAFAATWLVLIGLVLSSGGSRGGTAGFEAGVSPWTYLLTQARAITLYLKLSFWPHPLILDYGGWLAPGLRAVLGEFLLIATLFGATVYAVVRQPKVGFVGASFFAILAPSSSFYPLVSQTVAEHRMYLPLAAVLALFVLGLFRLTGRWTLLPVMLLAGAAGVATVQRGQKYASELTLWTETVAQSPSNPWARFNLGHVHFKEGRFAEAERENRAVIALMPGHADAHFSLGLALEKQGRLDAAADSYRKRLELKPGFADGHFRLGIVLLHLGRTAEALAQFAETIRLDPEHADAEGNLGVALYQLGHLIEALPHFERVLALRPDSVEARYNLALLLLQAGRAESALPHLMEAARLHPDDREIRTVLTRTLSEMGRHEEARRVQEQLGSPAP
ncbi:MAG TPA: tetratricopeptide repeat protein [Lacunisphaera sp.]|nr:tetratricopeptide repeat protein [Lacunisphaera sp.]